MDIGPGARFVTIAVIIAALGVFGIGVVFGVATCHMFFCQ